MMLLFAMQLALPLLFIGSIAFVPLKSTLGFWCQVTGAASALFALALIGLWLFPPWWTPYAFAALLAVSVFMGLQRRYPFTSALPSGGITWIATAAFIVVGGGGTYQSVIALQGRAPPPFTVVDLSFPLERGTYLVVNGGSNQSVNEHVATLDSRVARFHAYRGQSYGVDIVKLDRWGLRADGFQPVAPSAYNIYGAAVLAPCNGEIIAALDGLPDMQVPQVDREHMAGNHVLLRCKNADILLGHLKPGSVSVAAGNQVSVGDQIGRVGNSGNTGEPHLHIHAQERGTATEPLSGKPLPVSFGGRFLVRNDRVQVP